MRTTINFPDTDYEKLEALAQEEHRRPNEMLVLLARESLRRRMEGAERLRRFRDVMQDVFGGLDAETVRALDARESRKLPRRRRR